MDLRKNIILLIFVFFSKYGLGYKPFKMILDFIFDSFQNMVWVINHLNGSGFFNVVWSG
jgi:hypothetical protein